LTGNHSASSRRLTAIGLLAVVAGLALPCAGLPGLGSDAGDGLTSFLLGVGLTLELIGVLERQGLR
jgi:hypothetical protein